MTHSAVDIVWPGVAVAIVALTLIWLARRTGLVRDSLGLGLSCVALVVCAHLGADYVAEEEAAEQSERLLGLAALFAVETEALGHARLGLDTAPEDPVYLRLIDRQRRWVERNPNIADVYTYRLRPDGALVFIVDSETDYDRDGAYAGETEARTEIGEVYDDGTPEMRAALAGETAMEFTPSADAWGTWVAAQVPLRDASGRVEGALGVDFAASEWIADQIAERMLVYGVATGLLALNLTGGCFVLLGRERRRKLGEAYARAEAGARAKADFLAVMSHEIRTPMNGVLGMTELLLRTPLDGVQRGFAQSIDDSARHLLSVLNDVLEFSRGERGAIQFNAGVTPLRDLVESVARMHATPAHAKGLELTFRIGADVGETHLVDPLRLKQVLANLVGNAVKFTERGEVAVELTHVGGGRDSERLRFAVRDTGIGIAPHALAAVFEPFQQADGSTARRFGGSGLGLAISRRLVEGLGGTLEVESREGQGSCFSFELSLPRAAEVAPYAARNAAGLRLLIVAESVTTQRGLADQLQRWSMRAVACASEAEALAAIQLAGDRGDPFRIAILDDGLDASRSQLARRLREQDGALRVIHLSAAGATEHTDAQRFERTLLKPPRASELFDAIQTLLADALDAGIPPEPPRPSPRERRVLLVEDNPTNQRVAAAMLETLGCCVESASDGADALARVGERFDLVLMDCQMPVRDGYETAREWRRREPSGRRTPIVALTAHSMPGDREKCLAAGMDDYATKPFTLARLEALLARWAAGPEASAASGDAARAHAPDAGLDASAIAALHKLDPDDPGFARSIVEEFVDRASEMLVDARAALTRSDAGALRALAHQLKSNCAQLGAPHAAAAAARLEHAAAAGESPSALAPLLDALEASVRVALPALLDAVASAREARP